MFRFEGDNMPKLELEIKAKLKTSGYNSKVEWSGANKEFPCKIVNSY